MSPASNTLPRLATWLVVVGGLGAAAFVWGRPLLRHDPLLVNVVTVDRGLVRDVVTSSTAGEVAVEKHATVGAEVAGRVVLVRHKRGDRVKKGELIVAIDDADAEARVAQARAIVATQTANLEAAKAKLPMLERQAERAKMLADRGAGTTSAVESADDALVDARQAVRVQTALLAQQQASEKQAAVTLEHTRLTAPFDGLLVDVLPDPGEELAPTAPAFEIADDSRLHVNAAIDEADAARVAPGQEAWLTLDALAGHRFAGKVATIAPAVKKDLKGARTLDIEVEVNDARAATAAGLKPGMSANVEIVVAEKKDVVEVPTGVIIGRGVKRTVLRVEGAKAVSVAVQVGLGNWERTEIVGGLSVGDRVISSLNTKGLEDGAIVKVE